MAAVLVVDDDADAAHALAELLGIDGHQVRVAFNGEQAMRLLREHLPDLVLLDIEMPVLDGPSMVTRMLVQDAGLEKVPIVLVSGSPDLRRVAAKVGTPYFIGKPHAYDRLTALVAKALRERTPPKPRAPKT